LKPVTVQTKEAMSQSGYLGVAVDQLDQLEKEELGISYGIFVTEVIEDSPAEKYGIEVEDIIQKYDGKKIRRPRDLVRYVEATKPESKVVIAVYRDSENKEIEVVVGSKEKEDWTWHHGGKHKMIICDDNKGYLGVKLYELNSDLASYFHLPEDGGALVLDVMEESPAEQADIKAGDVIIALGDSSVTNPKNVRDILKDYEAGDKIICKVIRKEKKRMIHVTLDKPPAPCPSIFKMPACGSGSVNITVPETETEALHEAMKKMKENMKDMKKEIKIKRFGESNVI